MAMSTGESGVTIGKQLTSDHPLNPARTSVGSPKNPRNWTHSRRIKNTFIISLTGFLATLASSILVAAASILRQEFGKSREVVTLTTSIYVAGLGCGPFLFAPISELYGRQVAYSSSMILFTILNLVLCFAPSFSSILVLRLFSGIFGSSGPSLGVATLSDLFAPKGRGKPLSYYALGPMAGPTLGSVIGTYLVLVDWRWCFRLLAILVGINTLAIIFLMDETYAPVLRKVLEEEDGVAISRSARLRQLFRPKPEAKAIMIRTFTRPPRMLVNPACGLFVVYYAYVYSIIYVFLVSLPLLYERHDPPDALFTYNWKPTITGLSYLGLGCGFFSSAFTAASLQDRIYVYCSRRYKNDGQPEYRLCITQVSDDLSIALAFRTDLDRSNSQVGMVIFPIGLLIWGWTAQAQTHWIGPIIGSFILAYGLMLCFNSIQIWIVDAFSPYSAAAMAGATIVRSVSGAILPIFSDSLFINLGYGWGGTLLALVSLPAVPAPFVLFMYGQRLRERYKFQP
ncbi:BQ2448_4886 [Microbotryum intermedium]|uniref:BQ2448_4886 protein n=1 Tax=Microbotryum intermedium TaxID=269621 RepID=A0A238FEE3_9BASI|nr:BQ2448_4886 [Microbotryum intermedium]